MSSKLKNFLPEAINNFNAYRKGVRQIGITSEVQLADLSAITETIEGAGLLGKFETAIAGMYDSIKQEIPFRVLFEDAFSMANPTEVQEITLRSSLQGTVKTSGKIDYTGMRFVFRGRPIEFKPGTVKQGGQMGASVTLECTYILYELDGVKKLELDKINNVFKVNGKDILAKVRKQC